LAAVALLIAVILAAACDSGDSRNRIAMAASRRLDSGVVATSDSSMVIKARMFDRADQLDSARLYYEEAAKHLRPIRDWLILRAAGVTRDGSARLHYYDQLERPVAKDRRRPTEAIALERAGEVAGAIAAYEVLGDRLPAIRLRILSAADSAAKLRARSALVVYIESMPGRQESRDAIDLFDRVFKTVSPAEALALARGAYQAALSSRAVGLFSTAFKAGLGGDRDHFWNATLLARLNRDREAAAEFARVRAGSPLAAAARYQRARALLAASLATEARNALRQVTTQYPSDTSAASALMLLSDLATDEGRDAAARQTLLSIPQRFPHARHAPTALFRASILAYVNGDLVAATRELDSIIEHYPSTDEALAAGYWAGRSWARRGDSAKARAHWRGVLQREGGSYYSVVSAQRLGVPLLADRSRSDNYPEVKDVNEAMQRIAMLRAVGMDAEATFEQDRLFRDAGSSPGRLIATAHALTGTDQAARSISLGRRAVAEVAPSAQNYRLLYPVLERETLSQSARSVDVDPALVAGLIRQESSFNPRATSPVGARGLMQVMPDVGRSLARSRKIAGYTDESLYDPALNIRFGTSHLANLLRRGRPLVQVLAAYNAGESRVSRWERRTGAADPEMFTERISFVETRDYVRAIIRNQAFYRELYDW
jgi:soluble lytic murein transglycosylase-like protein